jgi:hypothetical protein
VAAHTTIILDTTAPAGVTLSIDAGAAYSIDQIVDLAIGTSDGDTTGYQMKVYGDVSDSADQARYRAAEGDAPWVSFATAMNSVQLSSGDGSKTVRVKIRDSVWNVSSEATDTITVDTSAPVPNITIDVDQPRISKVSGKRESRFSWQADVPFEEYKVKVVPATNSLHTAGTQIPSTNGSSNVSGSAGGYPATTNIQTMVDGRDLETASAGDGSKIVKVFVRDAAGNWSV